MQFAMKLHLLRRGLRKMHGEKRVDRVLTGNRQYRKQNINAVVSATIYNNRKSFLRNPDLLRERCVLHRRLTGFPNLFHARCELLQPRGKVWIRRRFTARLALLFWDHGLTDYGQPCATSKNFLTYLDTCV